jgi:hypothetical protein
MTDDRREELAAMTNAQLFAELIGWELPEDLWHEIGIRLHAFPYDADDEDEEKDQREDLEKIRAWALGRGYRVARVPGSRILAQISGIRCGPIIWTKSASS